MTCRQRLSYVVDLPAITYSACSLLYMYLTQCLYKFKHVAARMRSLAPSCAKAFAMSQRFLAMVSCFVDWWDRYNIFFVNTYRCTLFHVAGRTPHVFSMQKGGFGRRKSRRCRLGDCTYGQKVALSHVVEIKRFKPLIVILSKCGTRSGTLLRLLSRKNTN